MGAESEGGVGQMVLNGHPLLALVLFPLGGPGPGGRVGTFTGARYFLLNKVSTLSPYKTVKL